MINRTPNINLFIVGAAKSGTTSLYNYLSQHPEIFLPRVKEPNFYSNAESDNPADYIIPKKGKTCHKRMINDKNVYFSLYEEARNQKILADASPSYLWDKDAAKNIYSDFPNTKIIILLRSPIHRAYSHYLMDLKYGHQLENNFKQAILKDQFAEPKVWGKAHMYLDIGLYYEQVVRYLDVFDKKHVKIIIYEDFIKSTEQYLREIFDFLKIDNSLVNKIDFQKVHNPYVTHRGNISKGFLKYKSKLKVLKHLFPEFLKDYLNKEILYKEAEKPKLKPEDQLFLNNYYKEDIKNLQSLLGIDLSNWSL
ncbi:sulfotransferase family protein [Xanthomarina sp. F2636L]|uniref:sulfotransferase family protein n=1 Tax=Xanthomarina sp. F2636L TaxID=2996018 RepID=UPI00225E2850|nr:sulfotransferase [Xanthomarina sp. F2636L]MCX7551330.1 sulfotransferase [Xanthomarina sp. F2636L]